jgi:membrane-bound ClpP family serine protease
VTWIILLFAIGIIFVLFEVIVPGGVFGVLGGVAMIAGCVLAFRNYGMSGGFIALGTGVAVLGLGLWIEFAILPRTRLGRRAFLQASITGRSTHAPVDTSLVGREGETLTALAPSGVVLLDGRKYEAFSQAGFLERGVRVKVQGFDNFRLIVVRS